MQLNRVIVFERNELAAGLLEAGSQGAGVRGIRFASVKRHQLRGLGETGFEAALSLGLNQFC